MIDTNDPILKAVLAEIHTLEDRLAVLRPIAAKLRAEEYVPIPTFPTKSHAPAGQLKRAILGEMRGAGPLMSADLKAKIKKGGYSHPINGQYFTKTLRTLVQQRAITKTPKGAYSTYELKK